jgi:hypothetical protein
MERTAWNDAAGGGTAELIRAAKANDLGTLQRVRDGLRGQMAGIDPLSRHEWLGYPAEHLERRTVTWLLRVRAGGVR